MSQEETLTEAQKQEAKAMLKEKFGSVTRTGGKGRVEDARMTSNYRNCKKEEESGGESRKTRR